MLSLRDRQTRRGQVLLWVNLTVFVLSVAAIAASGVFFSHRPALRAEVDSTKTRAYSLSAQTQQLLGTIDGEWTIALVYVAEEIDRATLRQVEEVLSRFEDAAPNVQVEQIDPTDPTSVTRYETLTARLLEIYGPEVAQYEDRIAPALAAYENLQAFAQQEAPVIAQERRSIDASAPVQRDLQSAFALLDVLGNNAQATVFLGTVWGFQ